MIFDCSASGWLIRALSVTGILSVVIACAIQTSEAQQPPDPREAMVTVLAASEPHSSLGDEARVFDRFIGTWDCDYTFFIDDGSIRHSSGELMFGWILEGRALQDIWISYPNDGTKERGIGTSVRFFDTKSKMWQVIFVSPAYGAFITMQGGAVGDRIILRGIDDEGSALRWSFNDFKADSFVWRGEKSRDGGKTWLLEEEHHMRRRTASLLGSSGSFAADSHKQAATKTSPNDDPRTDMIKALRSLAPHASIATQAQVFDRFVGTWDLDCVLHGADGKVTRFSGAWIFGWALDGRVIQDVLLEGDTKTGRKLGTTVRFYEAKSDRWRVLWIQPLSGNVIALTGGAEGDRIVLLGQDIDSSKLRWSFNDIQANSFLWRGEISADGGKTWRTEQEMLLKRRIATSASLHESEGAAETVVSAP